jgi:acyl-CoA thioesterase II
VVERPEELIHAEDFLGMAQAGDDLHWRLTVLPELCTPGDFLFGGCGLGACLAAFERGSGRRVVWSTAQYLSYAPTHSVVDLTVTLAAVGSRVTQGRVVGRLDGNEILTVNAAAGLTGSLDAEEVWVTPPNVPPPDECRLRRGPALGTASIFDHVEMRQASGLSFEEMMAGMDGPGDPTSAVWARVPGHLEPSAATLAIIGDYITGGVSQPLGRRIESRSLDNTLRVVRLVPTEWVLCDIRIEAVSGSYGHGVAHLWSEDGTLLGIASQSMRLREWDMSR